MFLHNQSRFATELQGDVVPRNTTVLPADPRAVSGMQERFALHVPRWNLFELFSWSKSIREVRYLYQQLCLTAFSFSVFRSTHLSHIDFFILYWTSFKCIDASSTIDLFGEVCRSIDSIEMFRDSFRCIVLIKQKSFSIFFLSIECIGDYEELSNYPNFY